MFVEICLFLSFSIEIKTFDFRPAREFEIESENLKIREVGRFAGKQNPYRFTIEEHLFDQEKLLIFFEHGKELYRFNKFDLKWEIEDPMTKESIAKIQHRPLLTEDSYQVQVHQNETFRVTGDFKRRTFRITRKDLQNETQVANIYREKLNVFDVYRVKIVANENSPLILMMIIAIDDIQHD